MLKELMKQRNIAILTVLLLAGCQKNDDTPVQPSKVVTSIASPREGQQLHKGDTLSIEANISYISRLHGYVLRVVNTNNNQVLYTAEEHEHSDNFSISEKWVDTLTQPASLALQITAEITHEGDTSVSTLTFSSQP
jgi:hypothetical protein